MINRIKTTKDVESKVSALQSFLQVSSKAAVLRLAISFSLRLDEPIDLTKYYDIEKDGLDYSRSTLFGDYEGIFRALMSEKSFTLLSDDVFFPNLTFLHIIRGIDEIYSDYLLLKDKNKFLSKFLLEE